MKVLVADDHVVVRAGLAQWLKNWTIYEAVDAAEVLKLYRKHKPNVVVLEARLPGGGLECLAKLKLAAPEAQVLMFSGYDNPTYVARAVALGAQGYLMKGTTCKEFLSAVRTVADGGDVWTRETLNRVTGLLPSTDGPKLTGRESEVLKQLALGLSNREIGQALGISYETVKEHVQHILRKLDVSDRTQAAVWVVKQQLV